VGFSAMMDVLLSMDGVTFGTPAVTGHVPAPPAGTGIDTITFTQQTAQFIRLRATAARTNFWWAIGDMKVYP
jgi:hypothetical protein